MGGSTRGAQVVSAVVVNYNAGAALARCVESLYDNGVGEVVVVDNASVDASLESLRTPPGAGGAPTVVCSPANLGYGAGANLGAASASGKYLLVSNPDLVVAPGAVEALAQLLDERPEVAAAGPMLRDTDGTVYPSGRDFPSLSEALGHGFVGLFWGGNPWTLRYRRIGAAQHRGRRCDWISGAFLLLRRDAFDSVGGFDEAYFMYLEDVDLCWRLRRAGWEIYYEPAAEITHEQGRSSSRHPYRMILAHHRSMWRFAARTTGRPRAVLLPAVAVALVARLVLAWLEHLVQPRSRLRRAHR